MPSGAGPGYKRPRTDLCWTGCEAHGGAAALQVHGIRQAGMAVSTGIQAAGRAEGGELVELLNSYWMERATSRPVPVSGAGRLDRQLVFQHQAVCWRFHTCPGCGRSRQVTAVKR